MDTTIHNLVPEEFPELLTQIPDPPEQLRMQGNFPRAEKYLAVVGARKYSDYGKAVCEHLILGLRGHNIAIISGLALGIDAIAHRTAINAGLKTIAVPGSGLSDKALYPASHIGLRDQILTHDGCLLSEFNDDFKATPWSFPQRNRIMAGLADAVLVIEAELKSGTLITSKYATEYNRDVFTVPHPIFSVTGEGPHMLMRLGATPITKPEDILDAFGMLSEERELIEKDYSNYSDDERAIIEILREPTSRDNIIRTVDKPIHVIQALLSVLEIKGIITEEMGVMRLK